LKVLQIIRSGTGYSALRKCPCVDFNDLSEILFWLRLLRRSLQAGDVD